MVVTSKGFAVLTGYEMLLLQRLAEVFPRVLSKEAALSWLYQIGTDEEPEIKIIDVYICKIRKKTDPLGLRIDTVWGKGYALGSELPVNLVKEVAA